MPRPSKVLKSGHIVLNRAVDIQDKTIHLNYLTEFDEYAIGNYLSLGLKSIYLSFTSSQHDIHRFKALLDTYSLDHSIKPRIIAKVESRMGLLNLRDIASSVDGVLIDRGDLSREISISRIPLATKAIIDVCRSLNTSCYVATNILDSMMSNDLPSRAGFPTFLICLSRVLLVSFLLPKPQLVRILYKVFKWSNICHVFMNLVKMEL